MTLANDLSQSLLNTVQDYFSLEEVKGADGGPYLPLPCPIPGVPAGQCRVFKGDKIPLMVYVGAGLPMANLDSHMIFAFTEEDSLIPHFTLDAIKMGEQYAFHLDLIPRVDLGANLEYMNAAFQPLTGMYTEACALEGLSAAELAPRQKALMSPWMLTHRATEEAYKQLPAVVDSYLEHWFGLVEKGVECDLSSTALIERDMRNRAAIFNIDVDPVWRRIIPLLGEENAALLLQILRHGLGNEKTTSANPEARA